ncbi:UNVERIFIED_CONTAM: hypothetical protein ABIC26_002571 [Paenibacillus sp. PvR008]
MNIKDLIRVLQRTDGLNDLEVRITDGYQCKGYHLDKASFTIIEDDKGERYLDIGIGGCELEF